MKDRAVYAKGEWRYYLHGMQVTQEEYEGVYPPPQLGRGGVVAGNPLTGWPLHSEALAYHPKQKAEAERHLANLGVPTEIDKKGRPVLRDRKHRREVMKALGIHDNDGGYGDDHA